MAKPNEDGTYTVNSSGVAAIATFGEGNHHNHHENQGSLRFNPNNLLDIGGFVAERLIQFGLAKPGTGPRK